MKAFLLVGGLVAVAVLMLRRAGAAASAGADGVATKPRTSVSVPIDPTRPTARPPATTVRDHRI